jgi:RNA polymerase sigma factor (sigma-70 family)
MEADVEADAQLVERGELAELIRRHDKFLHGHLRKSIRDPATVDDVAAKAWEKVARIGALKGESLRPWLSTVAGNLAKDAHRGDGRRRNKVERYRDAHMPTQWRGNTDSRQPIESRAERDKRDGGHADLDRGLELERQRAAYREAAKSLKPELREAIDLAMKGVDADVSAKLLGVTRGTVYRRIDKAKEKLKALLGEGAKPCTKTKS